MNEDNESPIAGRVADAPESETVKGVCPDCGWSDKVTVVATGEWVCWRCGAEGEP